MIHPQHLRDHVIEPVLKSIDANSRDAQELLLLTAAQESHLGTYLHQIGGPALGIYQMEPSTHDDIWANWLAYKKGLSDKIKKLSLHKSHIAPNSSQMIGNLYYATSMARCHYLRVPEALPDRNDIEGMASYWKQHYNTPLGAGTVEEAISNYKKFVLD